MKKFLRIFYFLLMVSLIGPLSKFIFSGTKIDIFTTQGLCRLIVFTLVPMLVGSAIVATIIYVLDKKKIIKLKYFKDKPKQPPQRPLGH